MMASNKAKMFRMTPEQMQEYQSRIRAKTVPVPPKVSTPVQRVQALGRLKAGAMNKTEAAYAELLEQQKRAGKVAWFRFEGMKFRLADSTFYTPDFCVMLISGELEMHEIKGFWTDDARVKIKVAADMYPMRFVALSPLPKKSGGGWKTEEF